MMFRKRHTRPEPDECHEATQEDRLLRAEKRANVLFEKADWLHTIVTRRDQENHWQASVNRLFLGGNP
jgi:hypothetical protein